MIRRLVAAALIAAGCAFGLPARAGEPSLAQAMNDYEHGRYLSAEVGLRAAAASGEVRAQELLGFMYAYGPRAYPGIAHNPHEAALWFERAARGGSANARYMYCALTRNTNTYRMRSGPCFVERRAGAEQAGRE